jgi:hypothetical protein
MTIAESIANLPTYDKHDAAALADVIILDAIAVLQRDPSNASRSFSELELALANLRVRVAERLTAAIEGHVYLGDVLLEIEASPDYLNFEFLHARE